MIFVVRKKPLIVQDTPKFVCVMNVWRATLYSDKEVKLAHLKEFKIIHERLKKDPTCNPYRLKVLEECILRCSD